MNIENLILILFFGFIAIASFARNSSESGEGKNKRQTRQNRPQSRPSPSGGTPLSETGSEPAEDLDKYQLEARRFVEELKRKAAGAQDERRANAEEVSPIPDSPDSPVPRGGRQSAKPSGRIPSGRIERKFRSDAPVKAEASMRERLSSAAAALKNSETLLSEALKKSRTAGISARSDAQAAPFGHAGNAGTNTQTAIAETLSALRTRALDADGRRKFLRSAFVMSEIISKPVALRGGTGTRKW
ncbi:MAG: hypothetical protein DBX55_06650 [Verrucomicrobia bacterium]|nr:MAG: hypothetical protein DBX55_06650 [Verrucomicrobiota bacterium]